MRVRLGLTARADMRQLVPFSGASAHWHVPADVTRFCLQCSAVSRRILAALVLRGSSRWLVFVHAQIVGGNLPLLTVVFVLVATWVNVMVQSVGYHIQHFIEMGVYTDAFPQLAKDEKALNDSLDVELAWVISLLCYCCVWCFLFCLLLFIFMILLLQYNNLPPSLAVVAATDTITAPTATTTAAASVFGLYGGDLFDELMVVPVIDDVLCAQILAVLGRKGFLFVALLAVLGNCGGVLFDELLAVPVTDGVLVVQILAVLGFEGFLFVELLAVLGNCGGVLFDELLAVLVTDGVLVVQIPAVLGMKGFLFVELLAVLGNCGGDLFDELLAVLVTDGVLVVQILTVLGMKGFLFVELLAVLGN
ncbi:unnamed protein product [Polarella glacialis]|uniref:Uncharacterized protein n=1 Tax=Polarella glacialis TaxID=89957 RepID=A0A813LFJ9_POLGL|nr:unnamed protein product [Polarella glacialis]